jgi:hypothetical protein
MVRDSQELDERTDILIKAIERRFAIINGAPDPASAWKRAAKSMKHQEDDNFPEDWGASPKGTRAELLGDIAGILDEAITNIDDVSQHDQKNSLIGKSVRKLSTASKGFLNQMAAMRAQVKNEEELAALEHAAENAQEIIAAAGRLSTSADSDTPATKKTKP